MSAGTPGGRGPPVEPKEIVGFANRGSRVRTSDGRAAYGNGQHRTHGGLAGDEGSGNTCWNITVQARFLAEDG